MLDHSYLIDEWDRQPPNPRAQLAPPILAEEGADWSTYLVQDGRVSAIRIVVTGDHPLGFRASRLRAHSRGVQARIEIHWGDVLLSWAGLNVDDPAERRKLAETAWAQLHPSLRLIYPREQLVRDLDHFCFGLWDAWTEAREPASEARVPVGPETARLEILRLRRQLGITDTADLPERMHPADEQALLAHLRAEAGRE